MDGRKVSESKYRGESLPTISNSMGREPESEIMIVQATKIFRLIWHIS